MRRLIAAVSIFGLAACGGESQSGAGGVTAGEAKALDEAAEMIEQQRLPDDALRPPGPAEEQATPEGQPPAN